jgi:hypothetical protein
MGKTTGHILKANDVKLEGQLHLDLWNVQTDPPKEKGGTSSAPQARVIENHQEFATLEVTCCCGRKIYLKCEYANFETSA